MFDCTRFLTSKLQSGDLSTLVVARVVSLVQFFESRTLLLSSDRPLKVNGVCVCVYCVCARMCVCVCTVCVRACVCSV